MRERPADLVDIHGPRPGQQGRVNGAAPDLVVLEVEVDDRGLWQRAKVRAAAAKRARWITRAALHAARARWVATGPAPISPPRFRITTPRKPPHGLEGPVPSGSRAAPGDVPARVLQIAEDFDDTSLATNLLIEELRSLHRLLLPGDELFVWTGWVDAHPRGLIHWFAISGSVPPGVFTTLEIFLAMMGFAHAHAVTVPAQAGLAPLLYLGPAGLERLQ